MNSRKQIRLTVLIVAGIMPHIGCAQESSIHKPPDRLLPFLGFTITLPSIDPETHTIRLETVSEVGPGSIADKAGLKAGDVIVAVNGRVVVGMQPLELTQFFQRKPPHGETFDYQLVIERGLFKSRSTITFTAANPGSGGDQSLAPGSQVVLESSDGGWGYELGDGAGMKLHQTIASFEMYKIWTGNPNLLLYRVTRGSPSETGHDDIVWRIPYHEPFEHAVPSFAKWSPPKPAEDAKTARDLTDKFIANLSVR
jgi:hypothetical protein